MLQQTGLLNYNRCLHKIEYEIYLFQNSRHSSAMVLFPFYFSHVNSGELIYLFTLSPPFQEQTLTSNMMMSTRFITSDGLHAIFKQAF